MAASKMTCPECGVVMNHHADKLLHPTGDEEPGALDPALGGVVQEMHTCPSCGRTASRYANPSG